MGLVGDRGKGLIGEFQTDVVEFELTLILA